MARTLFSLEMLGEEVERRYRRARPDIDRLPWGTMDLSGFTPAAIAQARNYWTSSAQQEYQSTPVAAATVRALVDADAPLDLSALFARFPLDELAHAEICARFVAELGGAVPVYRDPDRSFVEPSRTLRPLLRAAHLIVRYYCVSEAFSAPMIRATRRHATGGLPRAILTTISKDESVHGTAGFIFLDWAADRFSAEDMAALSRSARESLVGIRRLCDSYAKQPRLDPVEAHALGWLHPDLFASLGAKALQTHIIEPLEARGFDLKPRPVKADGPPARPAG